MSYQDRKTCDEIASSKALWAEYVGPNVSQEESDSSFDERSYHERLSLIHELWPDDCTCNPMGIPHWEYTQELIRQGNDNQE